MPGGATYGASADFNKFPLEQIRWAKPEQLHEWLHDGKRKVIPIDVRDAEHYCVETIPGARNLAQGTLVMFWETLKKELDETAAAAADAELVLFANTGGVTGPAAGRDLFVLNFLAEVKGVGIERMLRLEGGLNGWKAAGFEVGPPPAEGPPPAAELAAVLAEAGLSHLADGADSPLAGRSFEQLAALLDEGRVRLLDALKSCGVAKLSERQKLANTLSKTVKALSSNSSSLGRRADGA